MGDQPVAGSEPARCLGLERLTYRFQGRDFRLTDVHGKVVHDIIA
ncbi:DUF1501 domain-containing protein [Candidatus Pelagisphaera phototrophica]|nr:DUF1501 domain-containing protein [Candidatus Pelagisphaera phototrophica]